jgi:hypothetical protein
MRGARSFKCVLARTRLNADQPFVLMRGRPPASTQLERGIHAAAIKSVCLRQVNAFSIRILLPDNLAGGGDFGTSGWVRGDGGGIEGGLGGKEQAKF